MFQNYISRCRSLNKWLFYNVQSKKSYATEAVLKGSEAKLYRLDSGPKTESSFTKDEALKLLRQMYEMRRVESSLANLYKAKYVRGFCHLYPGQEAVAAGVRSRMTPKDTLITSYRCHAWPLIMGGTPLGVIAELLGKQSGCVRGKGGSMHLYADNFYGGNGIVGAQVPLGAGLAFKHKYTNDGGCSFALYGDGASNQGQMFEAYNLAFLLRLPVIFLIENNRYGMGTSAERSSCNTKYYTRGDVIPGIWTDGMDLVSVRTGTEFAMEYVKSGKGPLLYEVYTYRYHGHSMSDSDTTYRSRDEIKQVRDTQDPINMFKKKAIEAGLVTEDEVKKIDDEVKKEIKDVVEKAKKDKEISIEEMSHDIYSVNLEGKIRQVIYDQPVEHKVRGIAVNMK